MRLFCAGVLWPQASSDRWRLRKSLILLFLVWLSGCSSKSFMERTTCSSLCSLRSLLSSQPMYCPATPHTASSDIKKVLVLDKLQAPQWLRTIWKSRAAQAFATRIDWRSDGVSNRRSTRKLDRRLSGTRTKVRVAEELRQATDRFALVDEEIIEVVTVYEKARKVSVCRWQWCCGHYSGRGWRKKHLFQIRKFAQLDLREVLTLQSSLSADFCKAAVGASMLCLRKQGQLSPGFVWEWWAGRRSVCQPRYACPKSTGLFPSTDNYHHWL